MKTAVLVIGLAGFFLSLAVLVVSLLLPIINAPRTSWSEAMLGIVPGALCSAIFLVVSIVGLVMVFAAPAKPERRRHREEDEEDDSEDRDNRPRRR